MRIIKRIPLPLSGVMLGTLALGTLLLAPLTEELRPAGRIAREFCGLLAVIMLVMLLLKLIAYPKAFASDMRKPVTAGISATFPMALMIFSVYWKRIIGQAAEILWWFAILMLCSIIVYFAVTFVFRLNLQNVYAAYFVPFAGGNVAGLTGFAYGNYSVGTFFFWFGLAAVSVMLVIVTTRYIRYPKVDEPLEPLFCIYTAPVSLLTACYAEAVTPRNLVFLKTLMIIELVLYLIALTRAVRCLRLPFYPSLASLTFPFVISPVAVKQVLICSAEMGAPWPWLQFFLIVESTIAEIFVVYVIIQFMRFIFKRRR